MTALGSQSPADIRRARDKPCIRDIKTGEMIANYPAHERDLLIHIGRVGYIDYVEVGSIENDTHFDVLTYRYCHTDEPEVFAYVGWRDELADIEAVLFPMLEAAE